MTPSVPAIVVGGGISGLACAYALRKAGVDAQVLETSPRAGGVIGSEVRDAFGTTRAPEEDESIATFVRRKFGEELLDRLVAPFVSGIYAGDPERISLRAAFPQLYEAEKSAGSAIRGTLRAAKARTAPRERPTLLSFRTGNETLLRALAQKIGSGLRL